MAGLYLDVGLRVNVELDNGEQSLGVAIIGARVHAQLCDCFQPLVEHIDDLAAGSSVVNEALAIS